MITEQHKYLSRNDIAHLLEISVAAVTRNESRLGLNLARIDLNKRVIRYDAAVAKQELRKRNQLPK